MDLGWQSYKKDSTPSQEAFFPARVPAQAMIPKCIQRNVEDLIHSISSHSIPDFKLRLCFVRLPQILEVTVAKSLTILIKTAIFKI